MKKNLFYCLIALCVCMTFTSCNNGCSMQGILSDLTVLTKGGNLYLSVNYNYNGTIATDNKLQAMLYKYCAEKYDYEIVFSPNKIAKEIEEAFMSQYAKEGYEIKNLYFSKLIPDKNVSTKLKELQESQIDIEIAKNKIVKDSLLKVLNARKISYQDVSNEEIKKLSELAVDSKVDTLLLMK